ncbi:unnamed protein product [uncultured bacterium]|nr:unnamed protein product [uncultured bacterium]
MSLREDILGVDDAEVEPLEIPEWNLTVYLRIMTARERDRFEELQRGQGFADIRARMAAACICDESGELAFTEADIPALAKKSSVALDRIFAAAIRLNRIGRDDVEELKKKSELIHSDGSSSGSH